MDYDYRHKLAVESRFGLDIWEFVVKSSVQKHGLEEICNEKPENNWSDMVWPCLSLLALVVPPLSELAFALFLVHGWCFILTIIIWLSEIGRPKKKFIFPTIHFQVLKFRESITFKPGIF